MKWYSTFFRESKDLTNFMNKNQITPENCKIVVEKGYYTIFYYKMESF